MGGPCYFHLHCINEKTEAPDRICPASHPNRRWSWDLNLCSLSPKPKLLAWVRRGNGFSSDFFPVPLSPPPTSISLPASTQKQLLLLSPRWTPTLQPEAHLDTSFLGPASSVSPLYLQTLSSSFLLLTYNWTQISPSKRILPPIRQTSQATKLP